MIARVLTWARTILDRIDSALDVWGDDDE